MFHRKIFHMTTHIFALTFVASECSVTFFYHVQKYDKIAYYFYERNHEYYYEFIQ